METLKFKKQYLFINISLITIGIALTVIAITITDRTVIYYIGIVNRIVYGICFIFNGLWNYLTNYYSITNNNKFHADKEAPKWPWLLIAALGIGMVVTAFMGNGFNGVQKPL